MNGRSATKKKKEISSYGYRTEEMDSIYPEISNNLTSIAAQLTQYNQELQQRTQERDDLQMLLKKLKAEVASGKVQVQKLQLSCDKLRMELVGGRAKFQPLEQENPLLFGEIRQTQKEIEEIIRERDQFRWETNQLKEEMKIQKKSYEGIQGIMERAQREIQLQQKERDKYKAQSLQASKQSAQLKDRVDEWMYSNNAFIKTLNAGAQSQLEKWNI